MFSLGRLKGTIMYKDLPVLYFEVDRGSLVRYKLYTTDRTILPYEFRDGEVTYDRVKSFWYHRIVPDTRQGINIDLENSSIGYYDPYKIIMHQKGTTFGDNYWLKTSENEVWVEDSSALTIEHIKVLATERHSASYSR